MTAMVTGPVVGIHDVYPDKLNSHILNGTKVRQNCSDNRNSGVRTIPWTSLSVHS